MQVIYNNFDFSQIGEVTLKQRTEFEGGDAPQRARIVVDVAVDIFQRTFGENYGLVQQAVAALETPNAVLQWVNSDTGEKYINQTAALTSSNAPEEWGQYFQRLELQFFYYESLNTSGQNMPLVITPDGGQAMTFDNVVTWREEAEVERFDPKRAERNQSVSKIFVAGFIYGDTTLAVAQRQASFAEALTQYRTAMNNAEALMQFGNGAAQMFSGKVKVTEFLCDVDQAICAIRFSFTAIYTLFPNEASYATVMATAEQKDELNSGQVLLVVAGKIQASDEPTSRAKLATVISAMLKQYGYTSGQKLEFTSTPNLISANTDGDTFTELSFSGQWRKWKASNQAATMQSAAGTPVPMGNVTLWEDDLRSERFDVLRAQRRNTVCTLSAGGTFTSPGAATAITSADIAKLRPALLSQMRAMKEACNAAQGTLVYGDFKQVVRVEEFKAKINQAETGIDWTLTANYVLFPGTDYATVEATAEEKDGFTGEKVLVMSGKIQAADEATARTKLATVESSFVNQYGYSAGQLLEKSPTPNLISANEDGIPFTDLTFAIQWRKWKASNALATFKPQGSTKAIALPNVRLYDQNYRAERFDAMRSERRLSTGMITMAGTIPGDMRLAVAKRQAALISQQQALTAAMNSADGTLVMGTFNQVVRVEEFTAHINQAETGIDWTLTASYTIFPNEGGYATCQFTAETRDEIESGDQFLTLSGTIEAPNGAFARGKLNTLRTSVLSIYGFAATAQTRTSSATQNIDANGDGTTGVAEGIEEPGDAPGSSFIRLSFSEEYRKRIPGSIISSHWQVSSKDDTASGLVSTTYSGSIVATGPSENAAIAAAILRAMQIGASKEGLLGNNAFLKGQSFEFDYRQLTTDNPEEFLQLQFSYEYQSKLAAGRGYLEVNTQLQGDTFGPDSETVSGFVAAVDFPTANALYLQHVRNAYAGQLIITESVTQSEALAESSGFNGQALRLEFSLAVRTVKPVSRVSARYALNVSRDVRTLVKRSQLSGDVFAANYKVGEAFIGALLAGFSLGSNMSSSRTGEHEALEDTAINTDVDIFTKVHFEEEYEDRLTGITGVIEMEIMESIVYSGIRWVVQDIPFAVTGGQGYAIVQGCGIACGSRTVRGSVTAATLATAQAWAWLQRSMLTGDAGGNRYPQQPQMENGYEFVPRVNGIPQGENQNVRLFKVTFSFSELLPNYPAPTT